MVKKKFLVLCLFCLMDFPLLQAEDGSKLWLRTPSANQCEPLEMDVVCKGVDKNHPTMKIAMRELQEGGWSQRIEYKLVKRKSSKAKPPAVDEEYSIYTDADGKALLTSASTQGLLYATYDLLRHKACGEPVECINKVEKPTYALRVLNHWDNLNGTIERGYAGNSLWKWEEMPQTISPRYEQYARACASVGINASVLNNVNASPEMLATAYLQKVKILADIFRPYGVKVYLCVNFASPKELGKLPTADPMDEKVIAWWQDKAKEIYQLVPDFGGFLVKANSEGKPGPCDYGRTHVDGANMLADALRPYGDIVMWRSFVYKAASEDRAMQALLEFESLDGRFRDNVILQIKNGPVDFQPREPFNPLFGRMPHTQQMVEFQITQEYLGASNHLFYQAPLWKECLDANTYCRQSDSSVKPTVAGITAQRLHGLSAIAGVANIGDDINWCGHHFAQANWYAFGRLAWNEQLTSEEIAKEWLKQTFTDNTDFVKSASQLMLDTREALVNYMMPIGLHHIFAEVHHYGPAPWYTEKGMRADWSPLYYHRSDSLGIGFDRTVATGSGGTAQYASPLFDMWENRATCPDEYLLWFHRVGWNEKLHSGRTLWHELCHRYQTGLEQARGFQKRWDALQPYVDKERFEHVQHKLKIQTHDAQWWKDACLLYFQTFHHLPFPSDYERPVYDLEQLMNFHIGLSLHGCPTRQQLRL